MKKKVFAWIATAALAGTALVTFAACGQDEGGSLSGGFGGAGTSVEAGARNAYGLGAVTTATLLADGMTSNAPLSARTAQGAQDGTQGAQDETQGAQDGTQGAQDETQGAQDGTQGAQDGTQGAQDGTQGGAGDAAQTEEAVGTFHTYFQTLDTFLDGEALRTSVAENDNAAYAFDYRLTVTGEQLNGTRIEYTMYYSETLAAQTTEQDDGETEETEAYRLNGVVLIGEAGYEMTGYRSVETERDGNETEHSEEFWIRAADPENPDNYVRMDLETETEEEADGTEYEREYVYSVYLDGKLTERTSVSFGTETENGATETEYELSILRGGVRTFYEVERAERKDGAVTIEVKYRNEAGERGSFEITQKADGAYSYDFPNGAQFEFGN